MKLTRIQRYLASISAGLLLVLSFPFTGSLTPLIFVALVPLLLVEDNIYVNRYKGSKLLWHAYITFFIYNIGSTWWIWNADVTGAWMAFILNSLLMAIAFYFIHFTKKKLGEKFGILTYFSIWLGFEYIHHNWELSWPWLSFGNVFSIQTSWIQWYEYTGILGGTFWVLATNLLFFRLVKYIISLENKRNFSPRKIVFPFLITIIPISISLWIDFTYEEQGIAKEIVITQPNIDPYQKFSNIGPAQQLHRIADIADQTITSRTKFVLAPETAIPISFDEAIINYDPGYEILKERMNAWGDVQLFIGASTEKRFNTKRSRATRKDPYGGTDFVEYYNSSLLMGQYLNPTIVHKSKLVLGAEKVPFSHIFPFLEDWSLDLGGTRGTLGIESEPKNISIGHFPFTSSICYESIYGEYTAQQTKLGSKAIFIITNDGWWGDTPGYKQHFSFARLRAIENRKYVARSANTGTSGVINTKGEVLESTDWWKIDSIRSDILINSKTTVYMMLGDILGKIGAIIAVITIIYSFFRSRKVAERKQV